MLKVRRISASSTAAARRMAVKIGGSGHARGSIRARRWAGRTRGRFSVMPPPVMWARPFTPPLRIAASALSPLGVWVSKGLHRTTLVALFVAFLLFAASMMLFYRPRQREAAPQRRAAVAGSAVGAVAGFVGGLLGVGGETSSPGPCSSASPEARCAATTSFQ
jgi:hypothetical protein